MIQLIDIHKSYGDIRANDGISLLVRDGSIHAVLGENGAGKSTLMKIMAGFVSRASGRVLVDGVDVDVSSPSLALAAGIGMLYQEPMDFPQLTVLENVMIGRPGSFFLHRRQIRDEFTRLSQTLGFSFHPHARMGSLTLGERQQIELLRLISLGIKILILDEPTTGISDEQKRVLFSSLTSFAAQGKCIILVSHKLDDVSALCDEVTVLCQGRVSGRAVRPFDMKSILRNMFMEEAPSLSKESRTLGSCFFSMDRMVASSDRLTLEPVSFNVHSGEVIGLAGLEGSGQELVLRTAAGLVPVKEGVISIDSVPVKKKNFAWFRSQGFRFVPGSRIEEGLIPGLTVMQHMALNDHDKPFFYRKRQAFSQAVQAIARFMIKAVPTSFVESLSGGNQQRLLLSLLPSAPRLLLLDNPTRGLDVESSRAVWELLLSSCTSSGTAVIFSSSELEEILQIADRVLVFFSGKLVLDCATIDVDRSELGRAIAGLY